MQNHFPPSDEEFWARVAAEGAPLVDPDPDDPAYRLVTFVHRDGPADDPSDAVLALVHTVTDKDRHAGDLAPHLMRRRSGGWSHTYRLRADHRASYQLYPVRGAVPGTARADWLRVLDGARPDPLARGARLPARDGRRPSSVFSLPDAPAQPYAQRRADVPRGRTVTAEVAGRRVDVHLPAGTGAGTGADAAPLPVLVLLDGEMWGEVLAVGDTLDNLAADGVIPPTAALLVHTMGPGRPEDLSCNPDFVDLLADRLLPWAAAEHGTALAPDRTVVAGQSAGGLTAAFAAFRRPDRFGNALCQSGSFWWPDGTEFDAGSEWLTRQFAAEQRRAARFWVEVGLQEWMLLTQNRHLRDVLVARGYDVAYHEFNGGHDYACWRGGLADGLIHLLGSPAREVRPPGA
ncbi:enterochelin esterase [Kitasatospora sp. CM 4170]|uniref:Enterochelin esterase n=1 Tax=Kitasatospora aburaviensis TaxID=67265 RepID=A0ABW1EPF6_9ACTN|nr:enterochelin esterase [Kitasatospora sp. CM 4170]WNM48448.1 enterochelin esterase [Kitasatospora sp. CM 4170]